MAPVKAVFDLSTLTAALPDAWKGKTGSQRVHGEYLYLKQVDLPWVFDLQEVGSAGLTWRFKLKNFPKGSKGGRELNEDLLKLQQEHQQDHLLMEMEFPASYPAAPPSMRLVTPKTKWYTGFVSCDGALLLEPLMTAGWSSEMCMEDLLVAAIYAMVDCEKGTVAPGSVDGPGGQSGPLRIDFATPNAILKEHSAIAAKESFRRMETNSNRNGFRASPPTPAHPAVKAGPMPTTFTIWQRLCHLVGCA